MSILYKKLFKKKNGSLTVEAAIALPVFICVFLSIIFFIKFINIQNNVQYALNGAANELATYSYLYSISGLQDVNDDITNTTDQNGQLASDHTKRLLESFDALGENLQNGIDSAGQLSNGDTSQVDTLKGLYDSSKTSSQNAEEVLNEIKNDPKKEFISIASLFVSSGFKKVKRELSKPLIRFFMKKYVDNRIFNSKGGPGAYIVVKSDQDPLEIFDFSQNPVFDFSKSKIFTDNKTIDIVVRYKVKTALPINIIPEITMEQRVTVRAWLNGDGSGINGESESSVNTDAPDNDQESMWDKSPFEYGAKITEEELNNYPDRYPKSGDAYEVRSINLDADSYKDLKKVKSTLKNSINEFYSKTSENDKITSRTLIIVVPEGTLTSDVKKVLEELKSQALAMKPPVNIIYKEGYGRSNKGKEESKSGDVADKQTPGPSKDVVNTPSKTTGPPNSTPVPSIDKKYSTAVDSKVVLVDKQDLQPWVKESFTDGEYRTVKTTEKITLYRCFGYKSDAGGGFATTVPANNRIQARMDNALKLEWNSIKYEAVIEVPAGTVLNIGKIEKQYTASGDLLPGGNDQILLPLDWPLDWIKEIRDIPSK